ncbi:MAG TPA: FkbM family methyltransferase [Thermoanaerobaculia bacterium]|nr:FkbM family methyltransferase [Thermoanaerobaculia bacterium]
MSLQTIARKVSGAMGRETALIRALRPWYERLLDLTTGGRGFRRRVNDDLEFWVDPRYRGYFPEVYEPPVYGFLRRNVQPGDVSLNVGAHMGIFAMTLAATSAPSGIVYAFEPNPDTRRALESHIRRNGFEDAIRVVPTAVSDSVGDSSFFAAASHGFSRLGAPNPDRGENHQEVSVKLTTIDEFCSSHNISPRWIVMDIEGYEVAALRGAAETIRAGRVGLVIEMHPPLWKVSGSGREEMEELLAELNLIPVPLMEQADPLGEYGVVRLVRTDEL